MNSSRPPIPRIIPILVCLFILSSCDDDPSTSQALKGDYFPLEQGQLNNYQVKFYNTKLPTQLLFTDTTRLINRRDTFIEGKEYLEIVRYYDKPLPADHDVKFYDPYKYVRRAGSQYFIKFAMMYIPDEVMFLDTEKNPGDSWIQYRFLDNIKIVYTIEAVNTQKIVGGRTYRNVIVVKEENHARVYADSYSLQSTVWHYYAKDVGEIYAYEEYSPELVYVSNTKTSLLRNK